MWTRAELKERAKKALQNNRIGCIFIAAISYFFIDQTHSSININLQSNQGIENFVYFGDTAASSMNINLTGGSPFFRFLGNYSMGLGVIWMILAIVVAVIITFYVINVLAVGVDKFFIENRRGNGSLDDLLFGFKSPYYHNIVAVQFKKDVYIFAYTLLLIIPGIIKTYEYHMVSYLLADHPDWSADEILNTSSEMMNGEKMNLFVLELSFIGWELLSSLTWNILGFLFVFPYEKCTYAELYETLSFEDDDPEVIEPDVIF